MLEKSGATGTRSGTSLAKSFRSLSRDVMGGIVSARRLQGDNRLDQFGQVVGGYLGR